MLQTFWVSIRALVLGSLSMALQAVALGLGSVGVILAAPFISQAVTFALAGTWPPGEQANQYIARGMPIVVCFLAAGWATVLSGAFQDFLEKGPNFEELDKEMRARAGKQRQRGR